MNLAPYRKFVVALFGVIALGLQQFLQFGDGSTIGGMPVDQVVDMLISLTTAGGVFAASNSTTS